MRCWRVATCAPMARRTHGPKAELDEIIEAAVVPAVWDRLVETYEQRFARL